MAQHAGGERQGHIRPRALGQLEQTDIDLAVTLVQASQSRAPVLEGCRELQSPRGHRDASMLGSSPGSLTKLQHCQGAAGTNTSCHTCQSLGVLDNVRASVSLHAPPVNAIKFSTEDLPKICQLLDLKVIQSQDTHDGSNSLYLLEQLMFLDSLASIEPPALKKRRMRNQHFWRDSAKLSVRERVYVQSAAVQLAIEEGLPVKPCAHLSKEQHTSVWTVCLTVFGVQELLNRRISPLGVRLFRELTLQSKSPVNV